VFYELPEPLRRIGSQLYYTHYYAFDRTPDSAETIVNHAIDAIKGRDDNVFLWAHLMDVHRPYTFGQDSDVNLWRTARITQPGYRQPTPRDQAHITGVYDQSVAYIDQQIERLYNWFDKQMTGETVFAVTADHGEEFGEHGDWFHGKFKLYDELLHVPLIIEGSKIPNTRIEELVSLIDVGPTLLDSADLNSPDWPGCSVLPLFDSDLSCSRENIISEVYDPDRDKLAVRTKRWKLIRDNKNGRDRLYRILSNKDEKENLYPEVDIPMNLERKIKKYCEQRESITGRGINDSVKDRLEQLGDRE
jgi:arylsulfatase A-like enzyme